MDQEVLYLKNAIPQMGDREADSRQLLGDIYGMLSEFFPIDTLHVSTFDLRRGKFNYMAYVINKRVMLINEPLKISLDLEEVIDHIREPLVLLYNDSNSFPFLKEITDFFNVKANISILALCQKPKKGVLTMLSFAAYGVNRYQPRHHGLLQEINGPLLVLIHQLLARREKDLANGAPLTSVHEIRTFLEHQRIDLVLNGQDGLKGILHQVEQVAPLEIPVLILGETGVGKELIANAIHGSSARAETPLVAVNCGAIADSLLDSELFGYEKGAFTGAESMKAGYFEQADKGTLFLDEIGELPLQAQTKLLRVLQNKTIQRVGGARPILVDVRIIAATNRNLERMVKEQKFRADLWYRLNVFPVNVPPLRDRLEDIPTLVQYLVNKKLFEMNLSFAPTLATEAQDQLMEYDWPGNIRELQNVIERELILCKGRPLSFPGLASSPRDPDEATSFISKGRLLTMDEMQARHIRKSLELSKGKVEGPGGAAERLGMNPSTLRARMKKLNIRIRSRVE